MLVIANIPSGFLTKPLNYIFTSFIFYLLIYPICKFLVITYEFLGIKKNIILNSKYDPGFKKYFDVKEYPLLNSNSDRFNFNAEAALFFYSHICNSFYPHQNKIIVLNGEYGTGKSSFITLLVNIIHQFNYGKFFKIKLFRKLISNNSIHVIRISAANMVGLHSESPEFIKKFLVFIGNNLNSDSKKLFNLIALNIKEVTYKDLTLKLNEFLNYTDNVDTLKQRILFSEQKNLLIIEDLDRLNKSQIDLLLDALWYIKEIPLLITLLPMNKNKINMKPGNKIKLIDEEYDLDTHIREQLAYFYWNQLLLDDSFHKSNFHHYTNPKINDELQKFVIESLVYIFTQTKLTIREFKKILSKSSIPHYIKYIPDIFVQGILKLRYPDEETALDIITQHSLTVPVIPDNLRKTNSLFYCCSLKNHELTYIRESLYREIISSFIEKINDVYLFDNKYSSYFFLYWIFDIPYMETGFRINYEERIKLLFSNDFFNLPNNGFLPLIPMSERHQEHMSCFIIFNTIEFISIYDSFVKSKLIIKDEFKQACINLIVCYIVYIMFRHNHHLAQNYNCLHVRINTEDTPFHEFQRLSKLKNQKYPKGMQITCLFRGEFLMAWHSLFDIYEGIKLILGTNYQSPEWQEAFQIIRTNNHNVTDRMIIKELNMVESPLV